MTPSLRRASAADVDDLLALELECEGADAWSRALVEPGVAGELPTVTWLVAEGPHALVGYAVFSVAGDICELQRIGVTASLRRRGIAGALVEEVATLAAAGGADRLLLEVREDNEAALGRYAQSGFEEIDRRPRYYSDGATAIVMMRSL